MAEVIRRVESDSKAKILASEMVNIDMEANNSSHEVFQIGLADLEGEKVLDCLTIYSEGIIAPSSPSPYTLPDQWQQAHEEKVRAYSTENGKLDAKEVVRKLQEAGISNKTMFLSWASWHLDLVYLRDWLGEEGFHDVLPGNENMCLLLKEFQGNMKRVVGTTCHRGKRFPLSLPILFLLLFGENHPLSGRNHHVLVDAQQLTLVVKLYMDLCKPPGKRVYWQESGVKMPGSWKRQRSMEEYFSSVGPNKKAKLP